MLKRLGLLAFTAIFLRGGYGQVKDPGSRAQQAHKIGLPATNQLVQGTGLLMMACALGVQIDPLRRASALVLALLLAPVTYIGHRFWEFEGAARNQQTTHFAKNLTMLGAALYMAGTKEA